MRIGEPKTPRIFTSCKLSRRKTVLSPLFRPLRKSLIPPGWASAAMSRLILSTNMHQTGNRRSTTLPDLSPWSRPCIKCFLRLGSAMTIFAWMNLPDTNPIVTRSIAKKLLVVFFLSFAFNLVWENLHVHLYEHYQGGAI